MDQQWITLDFAALVDNFGMATVDGLTFGAIYALIAVGYTMVYGVLGLINFAHAEFFITGCYALVITLNFLGFSAYEPTMPFIAVVGSVLLAVIVAMLVSAATAVLVERVAYRPLRKKGAPKLAFLITAIGCSLTIQYLFFLRSVNPEPALTIFSLVPLITVFGTVINNLHVATILAALIIMVLVDQFIKRTRLGRGIRAVAQDPDTAALMGVNRDRVIVWTFAIGGLLAGAATIFYVLKVPSGVQYNAGLALGLKAFTAAVLGGIGSIRGALLGGFLLGLLSNWGALLLGNAQWSEVVMFMALLLVLLFRPSGILGQSLGRGRM